MHVNCRRTPKQPSRVARVRFIDHIKTQHFDQNQLKENISLNDIRQSSYKLPVNRSGRKDHSLQKKQPIKYGNTLPTVSKQKEGESSRMENYTQFMSPSPFTLNLDQMDSNHFELSKNSTMGQNIKDLYNLLQNQGNQQSAQQHKNNNVFSLSQEEQILSNLRTIWNLAASMKNAGYFKPEMIKIQDILKNIIVSMAKPKINVQNNINLPLKLPSFKDNHQQISITGLKQPSVNNFKSQSSVESQSARGDTIPEQGLQFKKIMYILDQKHRQSLMQSHLSSLKQKSPNYKQVQFKYSNQSQSKTNPFFHSDDSLKDISNIKQCKNKSDSSFAGCSSQQPSGYTLLQLQKLNGSHSNDKIFLKNIVKKMKKGQNRLSDGILIQHHNRFRHRVTETQSIQQPQDRQELSVQTNNHVISEDQNQCEEYSNCSNEGQLQNYEEKQQSDSEQVYNEEQMQHSYSPKVEMLQTLEDESESKRATLNQIISMLNRKYNKNIHLQPRKY